MANQLTAFSNGITSFSRRYPNATAISIPCKRSYMSFLLASLAVNSDRKFLWKKAPSFRNTQPPTTQLDTTNLWYELATKYRGAAVEVVTSSGSKMTGKLLGTNTERTMLANANIDKMYILVLTNADEIESVETSSIKHMKFLQEEVRDQVNKILAANLENAISEIVNLEMAVAEELNPEVRAATLDVSYAIPTAAPKFRYQLTCKKDGASTSMMECQAIIDNPTGEDLKDYKVSVVISDPIGFKTDLATMKTPKYETYDLVRDKAFGAVVADKGIPSSASSGGASPKNIMHLRRSASPEGAMCGAAPAAAFACDSYSPSYSPDTMSESSSVGGEYCKFTTKGTITLEKDRSTLVSMFTEKVEAEPILLYQEAKDRSYPWRAVKFKNNTTYSLPNGVVTVNVDGEYSGMALFNGCKPDETELLVHTRENGVYIKRTSKDPVSKMTRIAFKSGVVIVYQKNERRCTYHINNVRDEQFSLAIEYKRELGDASTVEVSTTSEKVEIANGIRFTVKIPPKQTAKVTLVETSTAEETAHLAGPGGYNWITSVLATIKSDKLNRTVLDPVRAAFEKYAATNKKITDLEADLKRFAADSERKQSLLKSLGARGEAQGFVKQLTDLEERIEDTNSKQIPEARKAQEEALRALNESMEQLVADVDSL